MPGAAACHPKRRQLGGCGAMQHRGALQDCADRMKAMVNVHARPSCVNLSAAGGGYNSESMAAAWHRLREAAPAVTAPSSTSTAAAAQAALPSRRPLASSSILIAPSQHARILLTSSCAYARCADQPEAFISHSVATHHCQSHRSWRPQMRAGGVMPVVPLVSDSASVAQSNGA